MEVKAQVRPYIIEFTAADPSDSYVSSYTLAYGELERLLTHYPVITFDPNRIELQNDQASLRTHIFPATLGGGDAFEVWVDPIAASVHTAVEELTAAGCNPHYQEG